MIRTWFGHVRCSLTVDIGGEEPSSQVQCWSYSMPRPPTAIMRVQAGGVGTGGSGGSEEEDVVVEEVEVEDDEVEDVVVFGATEEVDDGEAVLLLEVMVVRGAVGLLDVELVGVAVAFPVMIAVRFHEVMVLPTEMDVPHMSNG